VTLVQAPSAQLFVGCICTTAVRKSHDELRDPRVRSDQINFQYLPENPRKLVPEPPTCKKHEAGEPSSTHFHSGEKDLKPKLTPMIVIKKYVYAGTLKVKPPTRFGLVVETPIPNICSSLGNALRKLLKNHTYLKHVETMNQK
jgi:hypothetical protein